MPILDAFVMVLTLASEVGGSGLVNITAPLPESEISEGLTTLMAITLANMLEPQGKLNGDACNVEIGIVQRASVTIWAAAPLQKDSSAE